MTSEVDPADQSAVLVESATVDGAGADADATAEPLSDAQPAEVEFTAQQARAMMPPSWHLAEGTPQRFRIYRPRQEFGARGREKSCSWRVMGRCNAALTLARHAWADHTDRGGEAAPVGHACLLAAAEGGATRSAVGDADANVEPSPRDRGLPVPEAQSSEQGARTTDRDQKAPAMSDEGGTGRRRRAGPQRSEQTVRRATAAEKRGGSDQLRKRGRRAAAPRRSRDRSGVWSPPKRASRPAPSPSASEKEPTASIRSSVRLPRHQRRFLRRARRRPRRRFLDTCPSRRHQRRRRFTNALM